MIIYKDYDTDDLIMNKPCMLDDVGYVYPVLLKDYKEFSRFIPLLKQNKKLLKMEESKETLLNIIINSMVNNLMKDERYDLVLETARYYVAHEFEKLFKMITKKDFKCYFCDNDIYFLIDNDKEDLSRIDGSNYDCLREIILKQNVIQEEKIYEYKLVEAWIKKARKKNSKQGKHHDLAELIAVVKNNNKSRYEDVINQNMFQFYMDLRSISLDKSYHASIIFKTVDNKYPSIDYMDIDIEDIYNDDDSKYIKSLNSITDKFK